MAAIKQVFDGSRGRYGARKVWHQLRREGRDIARCTVERLMKVMGLQGGVRGKKVITTNPDAAQPCPDDKVNRAFVADMPNQLWVSDFTYVSSWQGMVCVAFIIDVFARKIVGWRVSTSMTTGFVLDALNQAIRQRAPSEADKLIHHSDRGSPRPASIPRSPPSSLRPMAFLGGRRGFLRQRPRRKHHRPVQDRGHQVPRTLEVRWSGRMGNPEMGRLVQQHPPAQRHRLHHAARSRGDILRKLEHC